MTDLETRKARAIATSAAPVEYRGLPFVGTEVREMPDGTGKTKLRLSGYASVTEAPYKLTDWHGSFEETVAKGAFRRTLSAQPDVNLLVNHEGVSLSRTRAGTLSLHEDGTGLHAEARMDPKRPDVKILRSAIESGDLDEWSFSFRIDPGGDEWSDDFSTRRITSVNMDRGADVSVVNFGASIHTAGLIDLRGLGWADPDKVARRLNAAGLGQSPRLGRTRGASTPLSPHERNLDFYRARAFAFGLRK